MVVRRTVGLALAACVAGVVLAGCSGGPLAPAGLPVDEDGDLLPTVHGVVVDEAIRPLPGVVVRFLDAEGVEATTDEEGRYAIHEPTARAHAQLVTAVKPGFLPLTQQVQVSGHVSAKLGFVLKADPAIVPRVEVLEHEGTVRCTAVVAAAGESLGAECRPDRRDDQDQVPTWLWEINPTPGLAGAVVEVYWDALSPGATNLRAQLRAPMAGGQGGEVVAEAVGPSPLRLEVPEQVARDMPRWTAIRLGVEAAEGDGGTPGAVTRQGFEAFATLFYVDPAPAAYRFA